MDNQLFYVVQPADLLFSVEGMSLRDRRVRLSELIRRRGAQWAAIRMRQPDFLQAVERLDSHLGAAEELVNCAFENSPGQVLPVGLCNEYDPLLGYYEPERVRRLHDQLKSIASSQLQTWEESAEDEDFVEVVYAFRDSFTEAVRRGAGVAIEHS